LIGLAHKKTGKKTECTFSMEVKENEQELVLTYSWQNHNSFAIYGFD